MMILRCPSFGLETQHTIKRMCEDFYSENGLRAREKVIFKTWSGIEYQWCKINTYSKQAISSFFDAIVLEFI